MQLLLPGMSYHNLSKLSWSWGGHRTIMQIQHYECGPFSYLVALGPEFWKGIPF